MKLRFIVAGLLLATSALAQSPLNDVQFKWGNGQQNGFQRKTTPEIDRYDSLAINVDKQKFLTDAGAQLGKGTESPSDLETELTILGSFLKQVGAYHAALLNTVATAFIDETAFRGVLLGLLLLAGVNPTLANLSQAILYTLTTRLGAPGRDRYLLLLTLGIGLIGGWLTVATGGIAAAFLGHVITRFAFFLCTGHTGQTKPRGREVEEIEKRRRPPEGWRVIGSRESASRDR